MEDIKQWSFTGTEPEVASNVKEWMESNPNFKVVSKQVRPDFIYPDVVHLDVRYTVKVEPELTPPPNLPFTVTFSERLFFKLERDIGDWLIANPDAEIQHMSTLYDGTFYRSILIVRKKDLKKVVNTSPLFVTI